MQSFECAKIVQIAINILGMHYPIIISVLMRLCGFCWYGFRLGIVIQATFVAFKGNRKHTDTLVPNLIPLAHQNDLIVMFLKCKSQRERIWQTLVCHVNTLRPRQNGRNFQKTFPNAFSLMKMYEFQLRFHWGLFLRVRLAIFLALVYIMAWRRPGDKQLSEPMMV